MSLCSTSKDEYLDKKGVPLPDADQWELVTCTSDTPSQENGDDCGVFTCMIADFISVDLPLCCLHSRISTSAVKQIALSILKGQVIM